MSDQPRQITQLDPEKVYRYLDSSAGGLTDSEVAERLAHVGPNTYEIKDPWKTFRSFVKQFTNFFTILLIISALICFGAHRINPEESMNILGWALLGVSLLNAFFSFIQEYRAERAMEALKKFLPQQVETLRNGETIKVNAEEIVPGDVFMLAEGDKIPADARIVASDGLLVNNAPLTGEATPARLIPDPVAKSLHESENIAFAGCTVIRGSGRGVVFATGLRTEFGKVAQLSQTIKRTRSPLEKETSHMVRVLTIIATGMGFAFFLYGVFTGRPLWVNLVFMMGIIVANVPEGLLPTFTLALAIGSLRMAKRNVLVKGLSAVESLGAVHVICSDKTGTLTLNQLTITELTGPLSDDSITDEEQMKLLTLALAASEVRGEESDLSGDPLDVAVARKFIELGGDFLETRKMVRHRFTFDVEKRRSAGIISQNGREFFAVKGAFETIRPMLIGIQTAGNEATKSNLDLADKVMENMASRGLRVIAVAYWQLSDGDLPAEGKIQDEEQIQSKLEKQLVLAGFVGIEDPLRKEVPAAVAKCYEAGIEVILITGDHPETATAIARKSGIIPVDDKDAPCLTGDQLHDFTARQVAEKLRGGVKVFARTTPKQKMKIVTALKRMDKVVAMTGDGVNDAPALKAADIGIAMGKQGTDVARESAQIILLDDNFASIVAGIEEGRTVFANIKKFTNYVLVSNGPEILPYLLYVTLPVPLAMTVIQILSIDLGTDIVPSMGLGQEPTDPEVMKKPPRDQSQGLLTKPLILHSYLFLGLLEGAWSLLLFFYVLVDGGWQYGTDLSSSSPVYRSATGIALSTILLMQIGNLVGRRYPEKSGLDRGLFTNRLILFGIVIQIVFSWATLYFEPLRKVLHTGPVAPSIYGMAWFGIVLIFGADYIRKKIVAFYRKTRA